jgi:hypothetical protein
MLNNTYIEGLSQLVSILFQDNIVRLLVFVIVGLASYYIYLKIKKNNALEKVTFFSLIVSTLLFIGYMLNQYANDTSLSDTNSLTVLAFKTHKEEYGYNEYIGVKLKFNKEAYFYLFSETQKKMVFPNNYEGGDVHNVEANRVINLNDAFRVENNVGQKDEKLILLASTQKIVEYEELLEKGKDSYPNVSERLIKKALKPNAFVSISYGENSEAQFAGDIISVHIKKISIVINQLDSKKMNEQEELYIDTLSSANGYVTVFEGVPNSLHITLFTLFFIGYSIFLYRGIKAKDNLNALRGKLTLGIMVLFLLFVSSLALVYADLSADGYGFKRDYRAKINPETKSVMVGTDKNCDIQIFNRFSDSEHIVFDFNKEPIAEIISKERSAIINNKLITLKEKKLVTELKVKSADVFSIDNRDYKIAIEEKTVELREIEHDFKLFKLYGKSYNFPKVEGKEIFVKKAFGDDVSFLFNNQKLFVKLLNPKKEAYLHKKKMSYIKEIRPKEMLVHDGDIVRLGYLYSTLHSFCSFCFLLR